MRHRRVDHLRLARGRAIAETVVRCAEVRAALDHAPRDVLTGQTGVVAAVGRRHPGIRRDAARARDLVGVAGHVPVRRPLPDVPGDVVEAVAVRREAPDRRRPLVAVQLLVLPGKLALPRVRHRLAVGEVLVSPRERGALEAAAGGELPLRLGRQLLARPGGVGLGILVGDVRDRMVVAAVDRRALAARSLPERAGDVLPPVPVVVEVHGAGRSSEDERSRDEQVGVGIGVVRRVERSLRDGDVVRLADEATELGRRDRLLVHPEAVDRDAVDGSLLGVEVLRAHRERPARDPFHPGRGRISRCSRRRAPRGSRHVSRVPSPRCAYMSFSGSTVFDFASSSQGALSSSTLSGCRSATSWASEPSAPVSRGYPTVAAAVEGTCGADTPGVGAYYDVAALHGTPSRARAVVDPARRGRSQW